MENTDSFTPQEYAKMVGMFPDAPNNPLPTGGYMDEGFDWVVNQAESEPSTMIEVGIGSPSGSTKEWTRLFTVNTPYSDEELAEYVMPSMKLDLKHFQKEYYWREEGDRPSTIVNVTMGSPSGQTTGGWQIDEDVMAYGDEDEIETFTLNLMSMIENYLAVRYANDDLTGFMFSINHDEINRQADLAESKFSAEMTKDEKDIDAFADRVEILEDLEDVADFGAENDGKEWTIIVYEYTDGMHSYAEQVVQRGEITNEELQSEVEEMNEMDGDERTTSAYIRGYLTADEWQTARKLNLNAESKKSKSMFTKDKRGRMYARNRKGQIITHNSEYEGMIALLEQVDDDTLIEVGNYFGLSNEDMDDLYDEIVVAIKKSPSSYLDQLDMILNDEYEAENQSAVYQPSSEPTGVSPATEPTNENPNLFGSESDVEIFYERWKDGELTDNETLYLIDMLDNSDSEKDGERLSHMIRWIEDENSEGMGDLRMGIKERFGAENPQLFEAYLNHPSKNDTYTGKTASGHTVQWDDGGFYMTFKNPIDGYTDVSGVWYGGDDMTPSSFDLEICCNDDSEGIELNIDGVEAYGIDTNYMGVGEDEVSPQALEAVKEGLNWMLGDYAEETVVERKYKADNQSAVYEPSSEPSGESPATEPTNENPNLFGSDMLKPIKKNKDWLSLALGTTAVVLGGGLFAQSKGWLNFGADGDEAKEEGDLPPAPAEEPSLVASPSTGDLLPADYEEMIVESTGYAVPVIPVGLDGSFMGSRFHALPTDRLIESNEPGVGSHTDVAMYRDTNYREPEQSMVTEPPFAYRFNSESECECSFFGKIKSFFTGKDCCETEIKEANSITGQTPYFGYGFEGKNPQARVIKETNPISLDPSTAPYLPLNLSGYTGQAYTPPSIYADMMAIGSSGMNVPFSMPAQSSVGANHFGSRSVDSSSLKSVNGNLNESVNQSYTDGSRTMSLAQWSIEYDVSQISDTEAYAVSRSSGERKMIRRV